MPDMDLPGPRRGGGQKDLGRRGVGVLLQEMVLVGPEVVEAQLVRQFRLGQRLMDQAVFGVVVPGPGKLQLIQ